MPAKRNKLVIAGCLSAGLLSMILCLVGGLGIKTIVGKWNSENSCYNDRPPLRSFVVTLDIAQQKQLIERFRKFGNKNGFEFQLSVYTPNGEEFLIDLTRKDIEVIASNPFNPDTFNIGFHNNDCIHPTVVSDMEGLVRDLKSLIDTIPTAVISEEK